VDVGVDDEDTESKETSEQSEDDENDYEEVNDLKASCLVFEFQMVSDGVNRHARGTCVHFSFQVSAHLPTCPNSGLTQSVPGKLCQCHL
jgi:hypothetical protein